MKYGYCTGFSTTPLFQLGTELLTLIRSTGFDYVEYPMMNFLNLSDVDFDKLIAQTKKEDLVGDVVCNFFPGFIRLTGKDADPNKIINYLNNVLPKCSKLGIKKIVLGSGPARAYDENEQNHDEAFEQFASIIRDVIIPECKKYEIKVLIEPFERNSCNLITSALEGLELVKKVSSPHFSLMVDLFHMMCNNEPLECLNECYPFIEHVHIAGDNRRVIESNDTYIFKGVKILKNLGYNKTISFETHLPTNDDELSKILKDIKDL